MVLNSLIHGLWLGSMWLQGLVLASLLVKRSWRLFPFFASYSVFAFCSNVALYALRGHEVAYFFTYWSGEVVGLILGFGVVFELFRTLLTGHDALRRLASRAFVAVFVTLVLVAVFVVNSQPSSEKIKVMNAILIAAEATRLLEVGLIAFLFLFSKAFGLHWRQSVFGIALGLGVFVSVQLIGLAMRLQFGSQAGPTFNLVQAASFDVSLLIWIGYVLMPERVNRPAEIPKTAQLEQWNQAIMELIHQ